jgi:uncharacterized protein (DUF2147 family)
MLTNGSRRYVLKSLKVELSQHAAFPETDMKFSSIIILDLFGSLVGSGAFAAPLEGTSWHTSSGDTTIRIEACGQRTCGRILSSVAPPGQSMLDTQNPNPALRTRSIIGLNILSGFNRQPDDSYKAGTIYNPEDGKTYRSEFRQKRNGTLEVKGCVGPFCQSQIWIRVY